MDNKGNREGRLDCLYLDNKKLKGNNLCLIYYFAQYGDHKGIRYVLKQKLLNVTFLSLFPSFSDNCPSRMMYYNSN
jgi:hypothetical protein